MAFDEKVGTCGDHFKKKMKETIKQTIIQIHFPRFQLVFHSQLEEIPKVIMSAVECARLFILDQIH